uniref:Cdc23 domain-containing protein n=1 Tax=Glossina palpalis gambiensis TaxID=67801 RepID=A0A1B0BX49_9MUSC
MCHGFADVDIDGEDEKDIFDIKMMEGITPKEYDNYFLAKSYFDVREYNRAAHFVRNASSAVPRFLHLYAISMAVEKRRLDSTTDQSNINDSNTQAKTALAKHLAKKMKVLIACGLRFNNSKHINNYGMTPSIDEYGRIAYRVENTKVNSTIQLFPVI